MKYLQEQLKNKLCALLEDTAPITPEEILFSIPPRREFGDLTTTLPFTLAKKTKQKPFAIGNDIIQRLSGQMDIFSDIKLANGGFLNFYFNRDFLLSYLSENNTRRPAVKQQKMVVEHTSINPNKSAHIGHLRNASLGDSLAAALRFLGYEVEVQNYLDDTGIQVADVVWGLLHYRKLNLEQIRQIPNLASVLWELYPEVSRLFEENEVAKAGRNEVHRKTERMENPEYEVSAYIAEEVLRDHIRTMDALNIRYDLLVRESDIILLDFFRDARKILEDKGVMYLSKDPEKQNCSVIYYEKEKLEKIIIRSNGTVTYIGKDIAYTFWKVGLFQRDFYYRKFHTYPDTGREIYISDFRPRGETKTFHFGGGESVFNVIDVRQSYLQNIISQILTPVSPPDHQRQFMHFSYEMVALTPRCVEEMGFVISEEQKAKSFVEVSGRKGIAIKGDDLLAQLTEKSLAEVRSRHPELEVSKARAIAADIAIGALRYFMIKFSANSVIAFDFKDALAFEGDTGPYLQYSLVRINSILRKLADSGAVLEFNDANTSVLDDNEYHITHDLLLELSLMEIQVETAIMNHELSFIANYTYSLCQKFNHYYHLFPIVAEKDMPKKLLRRQVILLVKEKLASLLEILGIPIPERM